MFRIGLPETLVAGGAVLLFQGIVLSPLSRVREDGVRLVDFFHPVSGGRVVLVSVGVVLEGEFPVGLLDLLRTRSLVNAESLVVIFLIQNFSPPGLILLPVQN